MRISTLHISKKQLLTYLAAFAPFVYFKFYLNVYKWCLDRPNHQRSMTEPPTGLPGCMHDRFQEILFSFTSLFWLVLFIATYKLVKRDANAGTIIFTFTCCYVVGVIAFWFIAGLFMFGL